MGDGLSRAIVAGAGTLGTPIAALLSVTAVFAVERQTWLAAATAATASDIACFVGAFLAATTAAAGSLALPVRLWLRVAAGVCFGLFSVACHVVIHWTVLEQLDQWIAY